MTFNAYLPRRKGQRLSDFERGKIIAYHDCALSMQVICERVDRSFYAVNKVIKQYTEQQKPPTKQSKRGSQCKDRLPAIVKLSLKRHPNQPLSYHLEQIRMAGFDISQSTLETCIKEMGFSRSSS